MYRRSEGPSVENEEAIDKYVIAPQWVIVQGDRLSEGTFQCSIIFITVSTVLAVSKYLEKKLSKFNIVFFYPNYAKMTLGPLKGTYYHYKDDYQCWRKGLTHYKAYFSMYLWYKLCYNMLCIFAVLSN